jgi:hypothetical protein
LGWQLTMALYAYLQDITFAGQPAVENYKARSRVLRRLSSPLEAAIKEGVATPARGGTLVAPPGATAHLAGAATFANALQTSGAGLAYLDFTVNGELSGSDRDRIGRVMRTLGDEVLHVPVKLRRAPAAYHSTEQSEMDGPPGLISLRTIARHHEPVLLGSYDDTFLAAQAVATWQAMNEQGRACFLLILDTDSGGSVDSLMTFLDDVIRHVRAGEVSGESG